MFSSIVFFFRKNYIGILIILLIVLGFIYRINGLGANYSFWVDEASTARFARGTLETGIPKIVLTGFKGGAYLTTYYLTAFSFFIFGQNEFAARFPEVIFGTFLILLVYYVGKRIFNREIGLGAAILTAFSYIQIAWSRQARGYAILEVFFLSTLYFFYLFSKTEKLIYGLLFGFFLLLTIWTHTLGLIIIPIVFFYLLIGKIRFKFLSKKNLLILFTCLLVIFIYFNEFWPQLKWLINERLTLLLKGENFLSYYHSLFWRQYSLLTFLCFLGLISLWIKKEKEKFWFFLLSLGVYFLLVSLFIHVPFEKYILPIFPMFFLIAIYGLWQISGLFFKDKKKITLIFFLLIAFIILNGNKFSLKPRTFYSLNYDMREIPEINYKGFYQLVTEKSKDKTAKEVAIIEIDADIPAWYLGEGNVDFIPRNDMGKEIVHKDNGAVFIKNLDDFKKVYQDYHYGFVSLIEHNYRFYPDGFVDFVRKNLTLEKREEFAPFSPDWNCWPVELYSWGFNENAKD